MNKPSAIPQYVAWFFFWLFVSVSSATAASFDVNSTLDEVDETLGDGSCLTSSKTCTLRAAIMEANANAEDDSITLPAGIYTLTLGNTDEDQAHEGDLDIHGNIEIIGDTAANTQISGENNFRLISVFKPQSGELPRVLLKNLTLTHGRQNDPEKVAGIYNEGVLILQNTAVTAAGNQGYAIFNASGYVTLHSSSVIGNFGGIYSNAGTLDISQDSQISNNKRNDGLGGAAIYAENHSVVEISHSNIQYNEAEAAGGAVYLKQSSLFLENSAFSFNKSLATQTENSSTGGAIYADTSNILIYDSSMHDNQAISTGGAIFVRNANLTVKNSLFQNNMVDIYSNSFGGAISYSGTDSIDSDNSLLELHRTSFINNSAASGGALAVLDSGITGNAMKISHSSFYANTASSDGGAIYFNDAGIASLVNSTISDNSASNSGGGIYAGASQAGTMELLHLTIASNSASNGANIWNNTASINVSNSIIANAITGNDCSGSLNSFGSNLDSDDSCSLDEMQNDLPASDPLLDAATAYTSETGLEFWSKPPGAASPVIDAAEQTACESISFLDQRFYYRADGLCDIGAIEYSSERAASGEITFAVSEINVVEDELVAQVTVKRINGNEGRVSVELISRSTGTASASQDYQPVAQKLLWQNGESDDKVINIPVINDTLSENTETIFLDLLHPDGGASIGNQVSLIVNIEDDETHPGLLEFASDSYAITEGNADFLLPILRKYNTTGDITVTLSIEIKLIEKNVSQTFEQLITIPDGTAQFNYAAIPSSLQDNDYYNGNYEFRFTLTNPQSSAKIGKIQSTVVTVLDNEPKPENPGVIAFEKLEYFVRENDGTIKLKLVRKSGSDGVLYSEFEILNTGVNAQATLGEDFSIVGKTEKRFATGQTEQIIELNIANDGIIEEQESFEIQLFSVKGGAQIGEISKVTIHIIDAKTSPEIISFSESHYRVSEAESKLFVTVVRENGGMRPVDFSFTNDLTLSTSRQTIPGGETELQIEIDISKQQDTIYDGDKTFGISLNLISKDVRLGKNEQSQVTIEDDDEKPGNADTISIDRAEYIANENIGYIDILLRRNNATTDTVEVSLNFIDVTTNGSKDYFISSDTALTNGKVIFNQSRVTATVRIKIPNDNLVEEQENFILELGSITNGVAGSVNKTNISIQDYITPASISFEQNNYEFSESAGTIRVPLIKTNEPGKDVTVSLSAIDASAKMLEDFSAFSGADPNANGQLLVEFAPGENQKTVELQLIDNDIVDGDRVFTILLSNPSNHATIRKPDRVTIKILDDDVAKDETTQEETTKPDSQSANENQPQKGAGAFHPFILLLILIYSLFRSALHRNAAQLRHTKHV